MKYNRMTEINVTGISGQLDHTRLDAVNFFLFPHEFTHPIGRISSSSCQFLEPRMPSIESKTANFLLLFELIRRQLLIESNDQSGRSCNDQRSTTLRLDLVDATEGKQSVHLLQLLSRISVPVPESRRHDPWRRFLIWKRKQQSPPVAWLFPFTQKLIERSRQSRRRRSFERLRTAARFAEPWCSFRMPRRPIVLPHPIPRQLAPDHVLRVGHVFSHFDVSIRLELLDLFFGQGFLSIQDSSCSDSELTGNDALTVRY